ncbi:MAG: cation transporting ATPase C-terminal domain-containing protein, partial [Oceanipulchritudo sp.]
IGVAMGQRGTDAAKQAADIVLRDDAFATIVAAVRQGRVIFSNIRQSAMFMLTTNFAEILAVAVGALLPYPLPLLALQILFLNVVTDVFPALALGVGPGNAGVIHQKPRDPDEGILNRGNWTEVILWGVLMGAVVMGALFMALKVFGLEGAAATTVSFLTLGFAKLWFPFNLRHSEGGFLHNEITRNPWIWASIGLCALLLLAAVYLPGLNTVLQTQPPAPAVWAALLGLSLIPWVMGQLRFAMFGARP